MAKTMLSKSPSKTIQLGENQPIQLNLTTGRLMVAADKGMEIGDIETGLLGEMFMNPLTLARAVWSIFEDRIVESGVKTETEFYDLLDGEANRALDAAMKAAVSDFFTWGPDYIAQVDKALTDMRSRTEPALSDGGTTSTNSPES